MGSISKKLTCKVLRLSVFVVFLMVFSCSKNENGLSAEDGENTSGTEDPVTEATNDEIVLETDFTIDESRTVTNFVISESEYNKFLEGEGDFKMVTEKVYRYFDDVFDFIIILSVEEQQPAELYFGISRLVQNSVQGLGASTYNTAQSFGSAGKLKNIIHMPRTAYIRNGPFLHEIAHTWGNKGFIPTTIGGHWGYASTAGQLGGFDELVELGGNAYKGRLNGSDGFGAFANGGNALPYGNLELYLMGLIGANELETVQVAVNPVRGTSSGAFTADEIRTFTAEQLIADNGARVPSSNDSQKSFKALTVVISSEKMERSKMEEVGRNLENFSRQAAPDASWGGLNNFWMATQGKATFDFGIVMENLK